MNRTTGMCAGQVIGTMNGLQVMGLDIAKKVFQLHTVDMDTGEIINLQIKIGKVREYFANGKPCLIGIEACGSAHHWARELKALGHTVRLLHAKIVRPFVSGNKTDATDARAIWLAVQQPGVKFVWVKTVAQQATLTLHRQRFGLIVTEKLSLKNMTRAPMPKQDIDGAYLTNGAAAKAGLNRLLSDGAPAAMMQQCQCKVADVGSILMEHPAKSLKPTPRRCRCGDTHAMQLSERTYECPCGNATDRDENAARTMLRFAFEGARWVKGKQAGTVCAAIELSST